MVNDLIGLGFVQNKIGREKMDTNIKTIRILDTGEDRYTIEADSYILGRMFEHNATKIRVVKPPKENDSVCTMVVSTYNTIILERIVNDEPIDVVSLMSQYQYVRISFRFTIGSSYVKNSEIKKFEFLTAQKPNDYDFLQPEMKLRMDTLINSGYVRAALEDNTLTFYNVDGDVVSTIDLEKFSRDYEDISIIDGNGEDSDE